LQKHLRNLGFKVELESDGWSVKTELEESETDLLRVLASTPSSELGVFGILAVL
jgi:hypothetical protein